MHLGSGYWGIDSIVPVLARPEGDLTLEVRWPGGKRTRGAVPAGSDEVSVAADGTVRSIPPSR